MPYPELVVLLPVEMDVNGARAIDGQVRSQGAGNLVRASQADEGHGDGSGGAQPDKMLLMLRKRPVVLGKRPSRGVFFKTGRFDGSER